MGDVCLSPWRRGNGAHQVPAHRETVEATRPVRALVPRRELAAAEYLVCNRLALNGELFVVLAAVDEKRSRGLGLVFLQTGPTRSALRARHIAHCTHLEVSRNLET